VHRHSSLCPSSASSATLFAVRPLAPLSPSSSPVRDSIESSHGIPPAVASPRIQASPGLPAPIIWISRARIHQNTCCPAVPRLQNVLSKFQLQDSQPGSATRPLCGNHEPPHVSAGSFGRSAASPPSAASQRLPSLAALLASFVQLKLLHCSAATLTDAWPPNINRSGMRFHRADAPFPGCKPHLPVNGWGTARESSIVSRTFNLCSNAARGMQIVLQPHLPPLPELSTFPLDGVPEQVLFTVDCSAFLHFPRVTTFSSPG
jgi:hypothetical protein